MASAPSPAAPQNTVLPRCAALLGLLLLATGCVSSAQAAAPVAPAEPDAPQADVEQADAASPPNKPPSEHQLALQRQLEQPWSHRTDKDNQLKVPLADAPGWKRVRYWAIDHFVGFRYGDDINAVNVVMVFDVPKGEETNARTCMRIAEKWGRARIRDFNIDMSTVTEEVAHWHKQRILVHRAEAEVSLGFAQRKFSAAWAAYPAYEHACLLFAQAVPWDGDRELASKVLDRWVKEGVRRLKPLTEQPPRRK